MIKIVKQTGVICALMLLASCGGGGGGDVAGIDRGGIRGGIAVGPVTGFGSIFVNGVRYTTEEATVEIDGQPAASDELALGYVVRVEAEFGDAGSDPSAQRVFFDSDVAGPVDSLDASAGRLIVLGQQLATDSATFFGPGIDPSSFAGLQPGDQVRVSGFRDPGGQILAARIELAPGLTEQLVRGLAAGVDTNADRLSIGGLEIDYSGAGLVDGFPQGEPRDGDPLRAIGARDEGTGLFIATRLVYLESMLDVAQGDEGEIEGYVTRFASATDFAVSGIPVTTNAQTEFEDGQANDLALGLRVEVEGAFDASGVLVARELEFKFTASARLEGTVTGVDPAAGTLRVLGIEVNVGGLTNLNNLDPGDCVKLGGRETAAGFICAARRTRRRLPKQPRARHRHRGGRPAAAPAGRADLHRWRDHLPGWGSGLLCRGTGPTGGSPWRRGRRGPARRRAGVQGLDWTPNGRRVLLSRRRSRAGSPR
jgi:hypothetical protein